MTGHPEVFPNRKDVAGQSSSPEKPDNSLNAQQPAGVVDVLAAMEAAAVALLDDTGGVGEACELSDARAAVAELIAADREYDEARVHHDRLDSFRSGAALKRAKERRAAALTAIGAKEGAR